VIRRIVLQPVFSVFPLHRISLNVFFMIVLFLICSLLIPFSVNAEKVSLSRLIEDMNRFNGHEIEICGEIIGDIMKRRKGVWLNIDDGTESMGIWVSKISLPKIDFVGNYNSKGDTLLIKGIFNRACPIHGGETDIHVLEIERIKVGHPITHPLSQKKIDLTILSVILAIFVTSIYWWRNRKSG